MIKIKSAIEKGNRVLHHPGPYVTLATSHVMINLCGLLCKLRYALVRRRLARQVKTRKLRVLFVIADSCKWKCQYVYEKMLRSNRYDPYVAVTALDWGFIPDVLQPARVQTCLDFFKTKNVRVLQAASPRDATVVPLEQFNPDIVIYQQPWGIPDCQSPARLSRIALTFYAPYFMPAAGNLDQMHDHDFFKCLYGNLLENEDWVRYLKGREKWWYVGGKLLACGCPLREEIALRAKSVQTRDVVIYAPHWSLDAYCGSYSTFLKTGEYLLEYAKEHRDVLWVFRPHPMLRMTLEKNAFWPKEKIDAYYREWEQVGMASYVGDYLDIFARSRAMITDSLSFLSEYLVLNRPLIRLERDVEPLPILDPAKLKFDAMYRVKDLDGLSATLKTVLEEGLDLMKDKREEVVRRMGYDDNDVSGRMISVLDSEIGLV